MEKKKSYKKQFKKNLRQKKVTNYMLNGKLMMIHLIAELK